MIFVACPVQDAGNEQEAFIYYWNLMRAVDFIITNRKAFD